MARRKINKSEVIRDLLALHPEKAPLELAAIIKAEHGVAVPAGYVSTIKSNLKNKGKKGRRKAMKAGGAGPVSEISAAVELVRAAGSLAEARRALETIEEIGKVVR